MKEALALIEKIIEEHRTIMTRFQTLERVANDAEAIAGFEQAKDAFMPGRYEQGQGLKQLQDALEIVDKGLREHFKREETMLLAAFEEHGDKDLVSALNSLLFEHDDLRNRLAHAKKHGVELAEGGLSRHLWEASAHDMRAHISHTKKLQETHAASEQRLLHKLRDRLRAGIAD